MRNIFYCIVNQEVRQGKFESLVLTQRWMLSLNSYIIYVPYDPKNVSCSGSNYVNIAGVGKVSTSRHGLTQKIYKTFDDCKADRNPMGYFAFAQELIADFAKKGEFVVRSSNLPFEMKMSEFKGDEYRNGAGVLLEMPYWVWDGVKTVRRHVSNLTYDIFNHTVSASSMYQDPLVPDKQKYGKLYATKEECEQDNTITVVCFPDEEI